MMLGRLALWKGALLVSRTHAIVAGKLVPRQNCYSGRRVSDLHFFRFLLNGSDRVGSGRVGSGRVGSGRVGSGRFESGQNDRSMRFSHSLGLTRPNR